jgi:hypothetical protein
MFDLLSGGLLGSIFGGLFRLAPEVLKFFDKANERKHELAMFSLQTDLEKMRGEFKMEAKYVDNSVAQLDAIQEAFKEQSATAQASYKWVAALSALVRPSITYVLFGLYVAVKITAISYALSQGAHWKDVLPANWNVDDMAMLNGIITFWFLNRTIQHYERKP